MTTRINFGLHTSDGWQSPFEMIAKSVGYNFLCAKRHFEHVFADKPEIFQNGKWTTTSSENVIGKQWHFVLGCVELIPVIGHIVALVERFFGNGSLPIIVSESSNEAEAISPETTPLKKNATNSTKSNADRESDRVRRAKEESNRAREEARKMFEENQVRRDQELEEQRMQYEKELADQRIRLAKEKEELDKARAKELAKLAKKDIEIDQQEEELNQKLIDQFGPEKAKEIWEKAKNFRKT